MRDHTKDRFVLHLSLPNRRVSFPTTTDVRPSWKSDVEHTFRTCFSAPQRVTVTVCVVRRVFLISPVLRVEQRRFPNAQMENKLKEVIPTR